MAKDSNPYLKLTARLAILGLGGYVYQTDHNLGAFIMLIGLLAILLEM